MIYDYVNKDEFLTQLQGSFFRNLIWTNPSMHLSIAPNFGQKYKVKKVQSFDLKS